ncbi:MAG: hypothetical protein GF350_11725 [Chitinivibrionales bacterium]|nr:hypothetical protein [Chitinivibrionales bacterium]
MKGYMQALTILVIVSLIGCGGGFDDSNERENDFRDAIISPQADSSTKRKSSEQLF